MKRLRRGADRGHYRNAWLDARFSFDFGGWRAPGYDGFSDLRVLNDDRVAPGSGFAEHGHADVEVMSLPLTGAIEHRDSLGNVARMEPGDVHLMRAGRGIRHSEMNASAREPERHLQWWIRPAHRGLDPGYARLRLDPESWVDRFRVIADPAGSDGALAIAQDVRVLLARVVARELPFDGRPGRWRYLHVATGALRADDDTLLEGDAVLLTDARPLRLAPLSEAPAVVVAFDLRADGAA